jgi:hypothetical protein
MARVAVWLLVALRWLTPHELTATDVARRADALGL